MAWDGVTARWIMIFNSHYCKRGVTDRFQQVKPELADTKC